MEVGVNLFPGGALIILTRNLLVCSPSSSNSSFPSNKSDLILCLADTVPSRSTSNNCSRYCMSAPCDCLSSMSFESLIMASAGLYQLSTCYQLSPGNVVG